MISRDQIEALQIGVRMADNKRRSRKVPKVPVRFADSVEADGIRVTRHDTGYNVERAGAVTNCPTVDAVLKCIGATPAAKPAPRGRTNAPTAMALEADDPDA